MSDAATTVQLNQPIPSDLHRKVKVQAAQEGVTMLAFVIAALEDKVK